MADESGDAELDWSGGGIADEDAFFAMEGLQATLQQLEAALRQREVCEAASADYCDNFCQALMHYAGSRNSLEHGLSLLEVYCLSINCFAAARPHLTSDSPNVALVLKRLALSCFELLLSVPQNEIPFEAWLQFHGSVQAAHEAMLQYGSTDLQALLQIMGEGGAWSNPALVSLLTGQPAEEEEVNAYLALEGEGFLEMRIKHLEKVGEVEKALILTKACGNCSLLPSQATFRQTFVMQLCQLLPNEDAIAEISKLDGKDVLDIICNMETEGDENTAFILCTTYLTQQLQQESLNCSWELTLIWSKLQRRIDGSLESFLERCLQFGTIAKTVYHLLFLIRVIQTETMHFGLAVSVELCVKALQLPKQDDVESKSTVCNMVACLLPDDLEVLRACQLTEFLLGPSREVFDILEDLYGRPDQKYDEENAIIPNSLRCELLLALKAHWPFDPEFWDWKTLKHYCVRLLGLEPEEEDSAVLEDTACVLTATNAEEQGEEEEVEEEEEEEEEKSEVEEPSKAEEHKEKGGTWQPQSSPKKTQLWTSERAKRWQRYKFLCRICQREVIEPRFCHHARKHKENDVWTCPVCLQKFESKQEFLPHSKTHLQMPTRVAHLQKKKVKKKMKRAKNSDFDIETEEDEGNDLEPGQIPLDPSLVMYYQSTHDPVVLEHILEQAANVPKKQADDDNITFDYINAHYKLQNRDIYSCPATDCSRNFRLFKYLGVHLKNEHDGADPNIKHYMEMKDRREKCTFCRRTFMSAHHHRKHRRVHYGEQPYTCVVAGCNASFNTTNELIVHKHSHGFRLAYHCELKGCSLSFCDLGQLYHHEAQHFRDAAYTCTNPGCKKFYYSRKEFLKHLSTHGITFTEKDFEAQKKAKQKLLLSHAEGDDASKMSHGSKEFLNSKNTSPSKDLERREALLSRVAVCFDGKKFTCGWEECGRTFGKAREIQKHLKMVHSDQIKEEDKVSRKKDDETCSKTKATEETRNSQDKSPNVPPVWAPNQEKTPSADSPAGDGAPSSKVSPHASVPELGSALTEIVQGLGKLSLNCAVSRNTRRSGRRHASGSKVPQVTSQTTSNAGSPTKATPNKAEQRSHIAAADEEKRQRKSESPPKADLSPPYAGSKESPSPKNQPETNLVSRPATKPYACDVEGCSYDCMSSCSLKYHLMRKHGYSTKDVTLMDIFHPLKFKPFKCHICSNCYRERRKLKLHYLQKHNVSKGVVDQLTYRWDTNIADTSAPAVESVEGPVALRIKEDPAEKKAMPIWKNRDRRVWKEAILRKNGKFGKDKILRKGHILTRQGSFEGRNVIIEEKRTGDSLVPTSQCMDVADEEKHYACVHKGCSAAFMKQCNLLRHLQNIHHYNRSQLCYEEDGNMFPCKHNGCHKRFYHLSSLYRHYRKVHQLSEEPIPRFKCTYANCNATYHLRSSLLRHTNQIHQNQSPLGPPDPPSNYKFSVGFRKHVFYRRTSQSYPFVVRLQSAHKRDGSANGCQKKLIIASTAQSLKLSQSLPSRQLLRCCSKDPVVSQADPSEEALDAEPEPDVDQVQKPKSKKKGGEFVYRTPEEALQMCQDRCLPGAYPCMVQNCDSVVSRRNSLQRHYVNVHKMLRSLLAQNEDKLFYTAERLEELIQKKSAVSALPDLARVPNGVLKMEYQAEPENPGGPSLPMSLHSIKTESMGQEEFKGESPADSSVMIGADDVLYGDSNGHTDNLLKEDNPNQEEQNKMPSPTPPLIPPPPLDLSPPSTLRITVDGASLDPSGKESKPVNASAAICISANPTPTRQPLRRKNSELSEPLPSAPLPPPQKDLTAHSLAPRTFDIAAYKPLGFESSFLKFIQEKEDLVKCSQLRTVTVLNPCFKAEPPRRRDSHRRNGSVKENNERGARPSISRTRRPRASLLKPLLPTGECSSVQNLRFILERALRGCGDQAIKQLQFLRPVVVLERPKPSASLLDLLPSETKE